MIGTARTGATPAVGCPMRAALFLAWELEQSAQYVAVTRPGPMDWLKPNPCGAIARISLNGTQKIVKGARRFIRRLMAS